MDKLTLVIANKAYSSWSLRPWLALKLAGAVFEEVVIPLRLPETAALIARWSPAGKVPVLRHGAVTVWESIAIVEYLAELFPEAHLWPAGPVARAHARTICAEMHAGFVPLRSNMTMNLRRRLPGRGRSAEVEKDIARITAMWRDCRARFGHGGPFLFGAFSNADAMYAPVVTRFETYGVDLDAECRAYADAVLGLPAMQAWYADAAAEPWTIAEYEAV
ncbi:MAG: glutathione S-transferase family protein [Rhodospirillales bacterium]|nr:glutathione S-transferase family protein [Rhodospirillales bacterium]